jgi:hypothetical protein
MNCPVCGGPRIIGTDYHAHCRAQQKAEANAKTDLEERVAVLEQRVDTLTTLLQMATNTMVRMTDRIIEHEHNTVVLETPPPVRTIEPIDTVYQPVWKN